MLPAVLIELFFLGNPSPAAAVNSTAWVDWYARTPSGVLGTLMVGDEQVDVTFSGDYETAFTDDFPEPYWGPSRTYLSSAVTNPPPDRDAIAIGDAQGNLRLTFSQPIPDPVFAIASLGLLQRFGSTAIGSRLVFDPQASIEILSNGPNFYAGGRFTPFSLSLDNQLFGLESSGVIRLKGMKDAIDWQAPAPEVLDGTLVGGHLFNIGTNCDGYQLAPNPLGAAAAVPRGCAAVNREAAFRQDAALAVRGSLANGGGYVQGATLTVAASGLFENTGTFTLGEQQTFEVDGTFVNTNVFNVRGTLRFGASGAGINTGLLVLKGDNTFPEGGQLVLESGSSLVSSGRLVLEDGKPRALIGGLLESSGALDLDGGVLETTVTGTLDVLGVGRVGMGGILNRGTVSVGSGGALIFDRSLDFSGIAPLLDNRGEVSVEGGGRVEIAAAAPSSFALVTEVRNGPQGTWSIDGLVDIAGVLTSAGTLTVGPGGELRANGGRLVQAGGTLPADGLLSATNGGRMEFLGNAAIGGRLVTDADSDARIDVTSTGVVRVGALDNGGTLHNQGSLILEGPPAAGGGIHQNTGTLLNDGVLRVATGAALIEAGSLTNNHRLIVDGLFSIDAGSLFRQGADGVLVNNGVVETPDAFVFLGGRVSGSGTFRSGGGVTFGEVEFEPSPELSPGQSPGTLTFTGDLVLSRSTRVTMEFTENDGADRLVVGGRLIGNGATMTLVLPEQDGPGVDQVFDVLETSAGFPVDLELAIASERRVDTFNRVDATGRAVVALGFARPDAFEVQADEFDGNFLSINAGFERYIEASLVFPDASVLNAGTLGVRGLAETRLEARVLRNEQGAQFLNSGSVVLQVLENRGVFKNRANASLTYLGQFQNLDGRAEIRGRVEGSGRYVQRGGNAVTRVNGVLAVMDFIEFAGGTLTGDGRLVGSVVLGPGTLLAPGDALGTLTIDGSLDVQDAEIEIEIAGADVHDRLIANGTVALDGLIRFRLTDGYFPTLGSEWIWLFANDSLPTVRDLAWVVEAADSAGVFYLLADMNGTYDPFHLLPQHARFEFALDRLALVAAPVPLPGSWVLLLSGFALLRRRAPR